MVTVLCCNLSVCKELVKPFFRLQRNVPLRGMPGCSKLRQALPALKPWGLVGDNLCVYHLGDMASDGVVGQCRGIRCLSGRSRRKEPVLSLISAWNPLQIPSARPSLSFNSFSNCFFHLCIAGMQLQRILQILPAHHRRRIHPGT